MKTQKQKIIDIMKADEELGLYEETLEEVAERFYGEEEIVNDYDISGYLQSAFLTGAKWQQERSYSEEEVEFIKTLIDFYWSNYNNEHPNNLKDFELTKRILETFKKNKL